MAYRNLTDIKSISVSDINEILDLSQKYSDLIENGDEIERILEGKVIFNMFFENSTRTRTSFEMAAKKLGAEIVNWNETTSATKKNETFMDTILTLGAMRPDGIIIRHSEFNAPNMVASNINSPVVNAGDSWRSHPSQALLDALTIKQVMGKIEGVDIAICGDIGHSRVVNSNVELLTRLGAKVRYVAPEYLLPEQRKVTHENVTLFGDFEEGIKGADIIMMLRIQKERMDKSDVPSDLDYFLKWGLTSKRLDKANPNAYVMHPGPINRNVEISDDVADDPMRSLILKQVSNGIPVRMAILEWCIL